MLAGLRLCLGAATAARSATRVLTEPLAAIRCQTERQRTWPAVTVEQAATSEPAPGRAAAVVAVWTAAGSAEAGPAATIRAAIIPVRASSRPGWRRREPFGDIGSPIVW